MNELAYALDNLRAKYDDLEQEHEELLTQFNASEKYTAHLEERIGEVLQEKDRLEERLKQVVEDSELCRDRNRDPEHECDNLDERLGLVMLDNDALRQRCFDLECKVHRLMVALTNCEEVANGMARSCIGEPNGAESPIYRWAAKINLFVAQALYGGDPK